MKVYDEIENIVGTKYVTDSKPICYTYSMNCDNILQGIPDIVVRPRSSDEISKILKVANKYDIKITPRGGGADLSGGSKPIGDGGVVLDLTRMNNILDIDEKTQIVTVETGISWSELCEHLSMVGIGYYTGSTGPASGFSATVGGGLSNNSLGGGGAAMYGNVTEQCVGLEVVLPTGEIIYTGAKANSFCEKPFTRFGLGADYTGLFLGDVGIHGIKTKSSLKIYPLPEYVGYNTYDIKGSKDYIKATNVMNEWQSKKLILHDFFYYPKPVVKILMGLGVYKNLSKAKVKGGIIFYTTVANTQRELDHNITKIEQIAEKEELRKLGHTIEEGNLGRWFYEEDGRWKYGYAMFGGLPDTITLGCCVKCPTYKLPEYIKLFNEFTAKNIEKISQIGVGTANFIVFGIYPNYIDIGGGLSLVIEKDRNPQLQCELWKELLISQVKLGGIHYWMGEIIGQALVDSGALSEQYYNFMVSIKKALDPNLILSSGKFYLGTNSG